MNSKEHLQYLKEDFRGEIASLARYQKIKIQRFFSGIINHIICALKGVDIRRSSKFLGKSYFFRFPTSVIKIGENCLINSTKEYNLIGVNRKCIFSTNQPKAVLKIGNNCGFSGTVIGCFLSIQLGDNIKCGANTLITDSDWHLDDPRSGPLSGIKIEDNVWLGINVIVLKGVSIGENTIIGANSVVTKSIPANVVAAGNPCKVIKQLTAESGSAQL